MVMRAAITATYETPLNRKLGASPIVAISTPARAGPTMRVPVMTALFRLTALVRSLGPTISAKKLCRAGLSMAVTIPANSERAYTIHSSAAPANTSTHSANAWRANAVWVPIRITRLSRRSARRPAHAPSTRMGPKFRASWIPNATLLSVSFSTSQAAATDCIHVPVTDTIWPPKNSRKFREWETEWNVR
jgi:hypothetical protein